MIFADLFIAKTEKGNGVFTHQIIEEGCAIEIAPAIILPEKDRTLIDQTHLYNYYFLWGNDNLKTAIALGYGSIYNHSFSPNVAYKMDFENETITFVAWKKIEAGEELFINYNAEGAEEKPVWFEMK